jgi:hypothetical protein
VVMLGDLRRDFANFVEKVRVEKVI